MKKKSSVLLLLLFTISGNCQFQANTLNQSPGTGNSCCPEKEVLEYYVSKLTVPMKIDADWNKPQWQNAEPLEIKNFMARAPASKPDVLARVMYDDNNIYVIFRVEEKNIRCAVREINGPVWEDSAVEFFFSPDMSAPLKYFNLEINCGGVPLMRYNPEPKAQKSFLDVQDIKKIEISHSFIPSGTDEIPGPLTWTLEYKIPLSMLRKYSEITTPGPGTIWKANFYKIAHKSTNNHYISWSLVDIKGVDMHLPEYFGILKFR